MKKFFYALHILLIVLLTISVIIFVNPLRRTEKTIRKTVLKTIPIGTSMDETIKKIKSNTYWEIDSISESNGYTVSKDGRPSEGGGEEIGSKYIRVWLGGYRNIFVTDVSAWLAFDENSNLIEITIRKDVDAL
ncbi:MAG: hypothetical protein IKA17_11230 [Clostridia bacterium]|nr:hypothetical protein [Clostridia bacterium]